MRTDAHRLVFREPESRSVSELCQIPPEADSIRTAAANLDERIARVNCMVRELAAHAGELAQRWTVQAGNEILDGFCKDATIARPSTRHYDAPKFFTGPVVAELLDAHFTGGRHKYVSSDLPGAIRSLRPRKHTAA